MEQVLIKPIISEKSLNQVAWNWYTFAVGLKASKPEIKKAVEKSFSVNVLVVKTMVVKGKTRRVGRKLQRTSASNWKKAIVRLAPNQKIDLFEVPTSADKQ